MPLGQLVLIVAALLAGSGHGRGVLSQFGINGAVAALVCAVAALGGGLAWTAPLVPPVRFDLGSATLLLAVLGFGLRAAWRADAATFGWAVAALAVTVFATLALHRLLPHESAAGVVLDARTGLSFASGLIAAASARRLAPACSAAAAAYIAVTARDWVLLHEGGYTVLPLSVGGYALDLLVFSLIAAAVSTACFQLAARSQRMLRTDALSEGGDSA